MKFTLLLSIICLAAIPAFAEKYPEPDPPWIVVEDSEYEYKSRLQNDISGMLEWTLHKSSPYRCKSRRASEPRRQVCSRSKSTASPWQRRI